MQNAVDAYSNTAKIAMEPRQLEASLLLKSASKLQTLKENWNTSDGEFEATLLYNRRLWTIFLSSVADGESELPLEIKNNIATLGAFILKHTLEVQAEPAPEKLETLININKEIAAGLQQAA